MSKTDRKADVSVIMKSLGLSEGTPHGEIGGCYISMRVAPRGLGSHLHEGSVRANRAWLIHSQSTPGVVMEVDLSLSLADKGQDRVHYFYLPRENLVSIDVQDD